jgi:hypothetical protein
MTPEELDQSRIRIAGPPAGYDSHQGDRSNFDWMAYQLKELEKILGKEATADWINRPHSQLIDTSPVAVSMDYDDDEGCRVVAQLIVDLITDGPCRLNRCKLPARVRHYIKQIEPESLKSRVNTSKLVTLMFLSEFKKSEGPSEGLDILMECMGSMCAAIHDGKWNLMKEVIHDLKQKMPDSKSLLAVSVVFDALDFQRTTLREMGSLQVGDTKFIPVI